MVSSGLDRRVEVAERAHDQDAAVLERRRDMLQQEQRRLVRDVEVVQDEHERPLGGRSHQERGRRVEEADSRGPRVGCPGLGQARKEFV